MSFNDLDLTEENFEMIKCVGLDNYLFLTNDSNYELIQHYSENFQNKFDEKSFRESYNSKKEYCTERGIDYRFYVVPDKSVICKEYLPITPKVLKRNFDSIDDLVTDFKDILDSTDYYKSDSHINFKGALKCSAEIMHDIKGEVSSEKYLEVLRENLVHKKISVDGDLYKLKNPDSSKREIIDFYEFPLMEYSNEYRYFDDPFEMPEEFSKVGKRNSFYIRNRFSLTDLNCLFLRDSTLIRFLNPLNVFFKSMFAYWDHWYFNTDLIEWYKPDVIIELRTERFLEKMKYEIVE